MNRYRALLGGTGILAWAVLLASQSHAQTAHATNRQAIQAGAVAGHRAPEIFGTLAMKITAERFSGEWERARRDASALPRMRALIQPAAALSRDRQLAYIQSAVNRRIGWRSDATQWDRHDYWASAGETLSRGLGDVEDRAIVKMQALRALGFPARDLYLTLGRDEVAGPQAVLIVRLAGRYYVLDDSGDLPFTPERRPEFTPALTFGFDAIWAHVRRVASADGRPTYGGGMPTSVQLHPRSDLGD